MLLVEELIWQGRLDSLAAGSQSTYNLTPRRGGASAKVASYAMVVEMKGSTTVKVTLSLNHGPDGRNFVTHTSNIISQTLNQTTVPPTFVFCGDANTSVILHDFLQVSLTCETNAGGQAEWAVVQIYQILKPF